MTSKKKYEQVEIDIENLAESIAEQLWAAETRMIPENDLYQLTGRMIYEDAKFPDEVEEKQVHPQWAHLFWNLKDSVQELIECHIKRK